MLLLKKDMVENYFKNFRHILGSIKNFQRLFKPLGKKSKILRPIRPDVAWLLAPSSTLLRTILLPSFNSFALTQADHAASVSGHLHLLSHLSQQHLLLCQLYSLHSSLPEKTSHQSMFSHMPRFSSLHSSPPDVLYNYFLVCLPPL